VYLPFHDDPSKQPYYDMANRFFREYVGKYSVEDEGMIEKNLRILVDSIHLDLTNKGMQPLGYDEFSKALRTKLVENRLFRSSGDGLIPHVARNAEEIKKVSAQDIRKIANAPQVKNIISKDTKQEKKMDEPTKKESKLKRFTNFLWRNKGKIIAGVTLTASLCGAAALLWRSIMDAKSPTEVDLTSEYMPTSSVEVKKSDQTTFEKQKEIEKQYDKDHPKSTSTSYSKKLEELPKYNKEHPEHSLQPLEKARVEVLTNTTEVTHAPLPKPSWLGSFFEKKKTVKEIPKEFEEEYEDELPTVNPKESLWTRLKKYFGGGSFDIKGRLTKGFAELMKYESFQKIFGEKAKPRIIITKIYNWLLAHKGVVIKTSHAIASLLIALPLSLLAKGLYMAYRQVGLERLMTNLMSIIRNIVPPTRELPPEGMGNFENKYTGSKDELRDIITKPNEEGRLSKLWKFIKNNKLFLGSVALSPIILTLIIKTIRNRLRLKSKKVKADGITGGSWQDALQKSKTLFISAFNKLMQSETFKNILQRMGSVRTKINNIRIWLSDPTNSKIVSGVVSALITIYPIKIISKILYFIFSFYQTKMIIDIIFSNIKKDTDIHTGIRVGGGALSMRAFWEFLKKHKLLTGAMLASITTPMLAFMLNVIRRKLGTPHTHHIPREYYGKYLSDFFDPTTRHFSMRALNLDNYPKVVLPTDELSKIDKLVEGIPKPSGSGVSMTRIGEQIKSLWSKIPYNATIKEKFTIFVEWLKSIKNVPEKVIMYILSKLFTPPSFTGIGLKDINTKWKWIRQQLSSLWSKIPNKATIMQKISILYEWIKSIKNVPENVIGYIFFKFFHPTEHGTKPTVGGKLTSDYNDFPHKLINSDQIEKMGFRWFMNKDLDKIDSLPTGVYILNLDTMNQGGTHWTTFMVDQKDHILYYIDSFGSALLNGLPPQSVINLAKRMGLRIYENKTTYQPIKSNLCGYLALYIAHRLRKKLMKGKLTEQKIQKYINMTMLTQPDDKTIAKVMKWSNKYIPNV